MQNWVKAFEHYQQRGDIQPEYKPEWIVTMILSIISSAALDPNVFIKEKPALEGYIDFCVGRLFFAFQQNHRDV